MAAILRRSRPAASATTDEQTLEALRTWRFEPATRDGEPVPSTFEWTERYRC